MTQDDITRALTLIEQARKLTQQKIELYDRLERWLKAERARLKQEDQA